MSRAELAYALVQSLAFQEVAEGFQGTTVFTTHGTDRIALVDSGAILADLRGHVQLALDLGLMSVQFGVEQGPLDLEPTCSAAAWPRSPTGNVKPGPTPPRSTRAVSLPAPTSTCWRPRRDRRRVG